jgi:hypothetical protein
MPGTDDVRVAVVKHLTGIATVGIQNLDHFSNFDPLANWTALVNAMIPICVILASVPIYADFAGSRANDTNVTVFELSILAHEQSRHDALLFLHWINRIRSAAGRRHTSSPIRLDLNSCLSKTRGGFSQNSSANPEEKTISHHDFQTMGSLIKKPARDPMSS